MARKNISMKTKRILFIVDDFLPHSTKVAAKMMFELATSFKEKGFAVSVLTPLHTLKKSFEQKEVQGIDTIFFKSGKIKNIPKIKRAINESLLSYRAWKYCKTFFKTNHFDAIVYYSPSIFWGKLISKLKNLYNAKTYLILRDIFPQWTIDNGLMKKDSLIHKYFKHFERINYKNADCIGVMSEANLNWCQENFKNPTKFEVLPNWTKIAPIPYQSNKYRKSLHLENKIVFFYGGNIGHAQNMINLVDLAIAMKPFPEAHFLFVGKGDEVNLILEKQKEYNLTNVTYLPAVDQDEYFQMLSEFDVGLFNLHPNHLTHNFPGKLLGYMEYSKPILGCVNKGNDLKEVINEAKAGFIFENADKKELYMAAQQLLQSKELRERMGNNSFNLLNQKFNVETIQNHIEKSLF